MATGGRLIAEPAGQQRSEEVSTREKRGVTVDRPHSLNHSIRPLSHLDGRLAIGTTVAKHNPIGPLRQNLRSLLAFIVAIVRLTRSSAIVGESLKPASSQVRRTR